MVTPGRGALAQERTQGKTSPDLRHTCPLTRSLTHSACSGWAQSSALGTPRNSTDDTYIKWERGRQGSRW